LNFKIKDKEAFDAGLSHEYFESAREMKHKQRKINRLLNSSLEEEYLNNKQYEKILKEQSKLQANDIGIYL
jgi:hypothetical protein